MKNVKFPLPALGMDLLSGETALPPGSVRDAVNVDIDRSGHVTRRAGSTLRLAGADFHSLWQAPQKGWTLIAQAAKLYRLDPDSYALTELYTLATPHPLSFAEYNGNLYFSSRSTLGWIPSDSTQARPVGVPLPVTPTLSGADGGLSPGRYGVVISLVDERGEEGPATDLATLHLPQGGGLRLTNLPVQLGWSVNIYITPTDGDQLYNAASVPAVFSTYVVGEPPQGGRPLTIGLTPLPAGDQLCWHNGRLYTASQGTVRYSEALRPHLHDPAYGVIPFSGHIAFIESVGTGLYVGDSRGVWFLNGEDPTKFNQKLVSTARAVTHSALRIAPDYFPDKLVQGRDPVAIWLSTEGYLVGQSDGTVVKLQGDRIRLPGGLSGRSVLLQRDGRKQVLTPVTPAPPVTLEVATNSVI